MASAAAAQPVTVYEMFEEMEKCVHDLREGTDRIKGYIDPVLSYLWLLSKYSGISRSVYDFWIKLIKEVAYGTNRRNLKVEDLHAIVIPFLSANLKIKAPDDVERLKRIGFQETGEDTLEGSQFLVMLDARKDEIIEKRQIVRDAENLLLSFDKIYAPDVLNFSETSTNFNAKVEEKRTEISEKWKDSLTHKVNQTRVKILEIKTNMDTSLKSLAEEVKKVLPATEVDLTDVQSIGDKFVEILRGKLGYKTKGIAEGKIFLDAYLKKFQELVKHVSVQQQEKFGKGLQRQEALFIQQVYALQRCLNSLTVGVVSGTIRSSATPPAQETAQPQPSAQQLFQEANAIERKIVEISPLMSGTGPAAAKATSNYMQLRRMAAEKRAQAQSLLLQEQVRMSQQKRGAGVQDYPTLQAEAGPAQPQPLLKRSKQGDT